LGASQQGRRWEKRPGERNDDARNEGKGMIPQKFAERKEMG